MSSNYSMAQQYLTRMACLTLFVIVIGIFLLPTMGSMVYIAIIGVLIYLVFVFLRYRKIKRSEEKMDDEYLEKESDNLSDKNHLRFGLDVPHQTITSPIIRNERELESIYNSITEKKKKQTEKKEKKEETEEKDNKNQTEKNQSN